MLESANRIHTQAIEDMGKDKMIAEMDFKVQLSDTKHEYEDKLIEVNNRLLLEKNLFAASL